MKPVCLARCAALMLLSLLCALAPAAPSSPHWVSTWIAVPDGAGPALKAQTIRQIVRTSIGGSAVRVRLSNLYGSAPLIIGSAHVALRAGGAAIEPGSDHVLTFGGRPAATIARGESIVSDPVPMEVAALRELAVSLYLPAGSGPSTIHGAGLQTAYMVQGVDAASAASLVPTATDDSRYFLTDVEVAAGAQARAMVVVGDSIADGIGSSVDLQRRWPDLLAARLASSSVAVVNAGIAGNRVVNDAFKPFAGASVLARWQRDALSKPGVDWIVLHAGVNDISASDMLAVPAQQVSAEQIIEAMRTLVLRAREKGVRVGGATLLPYGGVRAPFIHSAQGEAKRVAVNAWIRSGGMFDAVVDFDQLLRDPQQPDRLLPAFDSGDHLHPNDAGYRAMAAAVVL